MKKILFISLIAVSVAACSTAKKVEIVPVPEVVLANDVDSMSYSLGVNMGTDFSKNLLTIPGGLVNKDLIIKGFSQALKNDTTLLTQEQAQQFFQNYMMVAQQKDNELKNRFLHVDFQSEIQSATVDTPKCNICTLEELAILKVIADSPDITQKQLAQKIGKSERTIKTRTIEMQEKGLIRRLNGKRNGKWEMLVELD